MCGIVGAVSRRIVDPALVSTARDRLVHRGPDHRGCWSDESGRVCLGHTRLSVVDLSPEAHQPFTLDGGRFAITFNGEIYNHRALRRELEERGRSFRTRCDTEVLLAAYAAWGEGCLDRIVGMFAFAIWDSSARRLFCARDRVGEKPFYYASIGETFVFASELKAIVDWPGFSRTVDKAALVDFLALGFVPDPRSIWEGCRKLEPGCCLTVDLEPEAAPQVHPRRRYWQWHPRPEREVEDWGPEIREVLTTSAAEMAVADVPIGTFLSGGVDSSSLSAALARSGHDLTAFTIGFPHDRYDERGWARMIAERYGFPLVERTLSADDVGPMTSRLAYHFDEPFNDYSYLPTFYLCALAREQVTVALSGDGADEILAGYRKYQRLGRMAGRARRPGASARRLLGGFAGWFGSSRGRGRTLFQYVAADADALANMLTLGFLPADLRRICSSDLRRVAAEYRPRDLVASLLKEGELERAHPVDQMRFLDLKLTLAGDILVKVDRASMAVSLEVRPVFLHERMLELSMRIPAARLAGPASSKRALKEAVSDWLPASLLGREKMGFAMPLGPWLRERSDLGVGPDSDLFAAWIDPLAARALYRRHLAGREDCTSQIHSLYFLAHWAQVWQPSG
ncbi:MAG TPA: asparagine synthase (glutamine-hydrolyzing) [Thermoanaerobaculia bacterium]